MSKVRWALVALGAVSAIGGGAAGAVLYTTFAVASAPAASVLRVSGGAPAGSTAPLSMPVSAPPATAGPKPSPGTGSGTHRGCPNHSGSSSPSGSTTHS